MTLEAKVNQDLVQALKSGDKTTLSTLRLLKAAAQNAAIAKRSPLTEEEYQTIIVRQMKMRREAIDAYGKAGRAEQRDQESAELTVLQTYLPEPADHDTIRSEIQTAISSLGASGPGDMGKIMARVMTSLSGRADGAVVSAMVRDMLASLSV